jgi:RHS repeat-associated protein
MKFTGHERDLNQPGQADDLDYMHARYHSPMAGRFLSFDPVGGNPKRPQSWNRYAYVQNRPLGFVDPRGLLQDRPGGLRAKISSALDALFTFFFPPPEVETDPNAQALVEEGELTQEQADRLTPMANARLVQEGLIDASAELGAGAASAAIIIGTNVAGSVTINTLDDIFLNPSLLKGLSPNFSNIKNLAAQAGWRVESLSKGASAGRGLALREQVSGKLTGRVIFHHPGGGHHGPQPYWKVSSPQGGTVRIGPQFD